MKFLSSLWRIIRISLITLGAIALIFTILAFTPVPFYAWYKLSLAKAGIHRPPEYIVLLGGGGMPSETGLIRCWYAAKAANHFTKAKIIIALPGLSKDSLSSINGMKHELELRGVFADRIQLEDSGTNTRGQALNIFKGISNIEQGILNGECHKVTGSQSQRVDQNSTFVDQYSKFKSLLIVTSPEHLFRAVLTFKKAGFSKVDGLPAFEEAIESDITFAGKKLGGRKWIPDIGENITIRYQYWTQLRYEEILLREYFAIIYYWSKGWI